MVEPPRGVADYEFVRRLSSSPGAEFFLATPPDRLAVDDAHVVVKVVSAPRDEDSLRRAVRELRAFAATRSPYLVPVLDAGRQDRYFFYATRYYPLGSLREPASALDRARVLGVVADAARAAQAMHLAGLVHRGISPSCVLVADDGGRLADLGLAQERNPGQTVTAMGAAGDAEFLDPAILLGEPAAPATDIWSLGVCLHFGLAGAGIYGDLASADTLVAIRKVLRGEPELSAGLAPADAAVIEACLRRDPRDRPSDAEELARLLDGLVRS